MARGEKGHVEPDGSKTTPKGYRPTPPEEKRDPAHQAEAQNEGGEKVTEPYKQAPTGKLPGAPVNDEEGASSKGPPFPREEGGLEHSNDVTEVVEGRLGGGEKLIYKAGEGPDDPPVLHPSDPTPKSHDDPPKK